MEVFTATPTASSSSTSDIDRTPSLDAPTAEIVYTGDACALAPSSNLRNNQSHDELKISVYPELKATRDPSVDKPGTCSNGRATFNVCMTAFGVGITFLPKIMATSGWIGGILLMLATNLYGNFCTRRLYQVLVTNASGRRLVSFEELGEVTFGRVGKYLFRGLLCTVIFGLAIYMLELQANAGYYLSGEMLSKDAWRWIMNIPLIILAWIPSLKEVGLVSGGGVVATLGLMALIAASSAAYMQSPGWADGVIKVQGQDMQVVDAPLLYSLGPKELLPFCSAVCQAMLAYGVVATTPSIVHSMQEPADYPRVNNRSFVVIGFVYMVVACVSYAAFGDNVSDNVIASIALASGDIGVLRTLNLIMQVVVVVLVISNLLVMLTPLAAASEELLAFVFSSVAQPKAVDPEAGSTSEEAPSAWVAVRRSAARSSVVIVAISATVALQSGADRVHAFVTLIAGLAVMPIVVLVPICCFWRTLQQTKQPHPNRLVMVCEVLLVLLCIGCAAVMMVDFSRLIVEVNNGQT